MFRVDRMSWISQPSTLLDEPAELTSAELIVISVLGSPCIYFISQNIGLKKNKKSMFFLTHDLKLCVLASLQEPIYLAKQQQY